MTRKADFSVANAARALRASMKVPGKWEVAIEPCGTIIIREAVASAPKQKRLPPPVAHA